jgi:amino acid transporter
MASIVPSSKREEGLQLQYNNGGKGGTTAVKDNKMGRWGATAYFVGNIVGSGIFITPTSILGRTQSIGLSLVVWLLSAVATSIGSFCYVELGTSIRRSGCDFAYLSHVKWSAVFLMNFGI